MKTKLMILVAACFTLSGPAVLALPIKVERSADNRDKVEARVNAANLGTVKLPQGRAVLSGDRIIVRAVPDWMFDGHTVLSGRLVSIKSQSSAGGTAITGTAYFLDGDWLNSLDKFKSKDNLQTGDGQVLTGRIRAINPDSLDFQTTEGKTSRIKLADITGLESPRAFEFSSPTSQVRVDPQSGGLEGDATTIVFTPTMTPGRAGLFARRPKLKEPKSVLAGSEGGVSKAALAGMVALDVINTIAPAIVAPIVAPNSADSAYARLNKFQQETRDLGL